MKDLSNKISDFLNVGIRDHLDNFSLLLLRVVFGGGMLVVHGRMKLINYESMVNQFPDVLNIGSGQANLLLALFAEVVCAALVSIGLLTRLAAIPLIITMSIAFFVVHANDPFEKKELALMFLVAYVVILLRGAGSISIDGVWGRKK